jgi:transcriptional regulator with PAS, ATPase and Fis domain
MRIVGATNSDLERNVQEGCFREDLYYRLNVVNIDIPMLRERKQEIPISVKYFVDIYGKKYGNGTRAPSGKLMRMFLCYRWPGNVRELENLGKRFVVLGDEVAIIEELNSANIRKRKGVPRSNP